MPQQMGGRTVVATGALGLLWIIVYWLWPVGGTSSGTIEARAGDDPPTLPPPRFEHRPIHRTSSMNTPEFFDHRLEDGETFASVSERYFGTPIHADAIARSNPLTSPDRLHAGRVIRVPRDPSNIQGASPEGIPHLPEGEYVVRRGDTLSGIARRLHGDAGFAGLIFEANRDVLTDGNTLREGQRLRIPRRKAESRGR
jgi:hypothetical protein